MISLVFNQKTKASDMAGKFRDNSEDRGTTKDRMVRRIPLSVYKKIEKLADENEMSVNSYLVKILADHVERDLKKKHNKNKK